jgi:hypothetical protein
MALRMQGAARSLVLIVLLAGVAACNTTSLVDRPRAVSPQLIADDSVASDLRVLADGTWQKFTAAFEVRSGCFGDVRLHAARDLGSRAAYDPETATVMVQVPATVAMLESALVHEWAHHIEFQCPDQEELRPVFLAALGLPVDTPWRPDDTSAKMPAADWSRIPSEQYAEAVVEYVLGRRPIPTGAVVRQAAIDVIAQWAAH